MNQEDNTEKVIIYFGFFLISVFENVLVAPKVTLSIYFLESYYRYNEHNVIIL